MIKKFNKGFKFFLCVIDIYSKYAWVIAFKNEKGITITNSFQKLLDESIRKQNKIWLDKGSEFYNRSVMYLCRRVIWTCTQRTMKENLLLLKGSQEP